MNQTQIITTLGPIFGLVAGYLAAWWGIDQAEAAGILTALIGIFCAVYNAIVTRKSAMITTVANMPEIKKDGEGIVLDKTVPGSAALVASTPDNVVAK